MKTLERYSYSRIVRHLVQSPPRPDVFERDATATRFTGNRLEDRTPKTSHLALETLERYSYGRRVVRYQVLLCPPAPSGLCPHDYGNTLYEYTPLTLMSLSGICRDPIRSQPAEGRRSTSTFGTQTGSTQTTSLAKRNAECTSRKVARRNRPEMCTFSVVVGVEGG